MITIAEFERCMTRAGVFGVIVDDFRHWQKLCLIILLPIDKDMKVCFYHAFWLFHLSVCLGVEHGGKSSFDTEEVTQQGPKFGHKNRFLVTNNGVQEAVMSYHYIYDNFRQYWSVNGDFDQLIIHHLGQVVDYNQNRVVAIRIELQLSSCFSFSQRTTANRSQSLWRDSSIDKSVPQVSIELVADSF